MDVLKGIEYEFSKHDHLGSSSLTTTLKSTDNLYFINRTERGGIYSHETIIENQCIRTNYLSLLEDIQLIIAGHELTPW